MDLGCDPPGFGAGHCEVPTEGPPRCATPSPGHGHCPHGHDRTQSECPELGPNSNHTRPRSKQLPSPHFSKDSVEFRAP
eukprot:4323902-Alexandrium_andersonii.AAC.1